MSGDMTDKAIAIMRGEQPMDAEMDGFLAMLDRINRGTDEVAQSPIESV